VESLKNQFPAAKDVHNLDAAATGLLPQEVIDAVNRYWIESGATAGRSPYAKSAIATKLVEESRKEIAGWFNVSIEETVFTPGATHSLNWVAKGLDFQTGDKILVTRADHHANILPWMDLKTKGIELVWADCDRNGVIDVDDFARKCKRCKVAAFSGASNVSGAIQPIARLSAIAKESGAISVVDAAQLAPHGQIDFQSVGCDFMAVAGHKMMAPKGLGLLLGRKEAFSKLRPTIVGGGVVAEVTEDGYKLLPKPLEYESGTQSLEGIIGLAQSIRWQKANDWHKIEERLKTFNRQLCDYLSEKNVEILHPTESTPTISIILKNADPAEIARKLDETAGIQVRTGFLCAMPYLKWIGATNGVMRISFGPWNEVADIEAATKQLDVFLK
jgi:cysteine desulfurase/selenocysteine lyase